MAKLKMKKMQLIFLQNESRELLGELQRLGVAELYEIADERLEKISVKSRTAAIERNLKCAEDCLDIMNSYVPPSGGIASMFSGRQEISAEEYCRKSEEADAFLKIAGDICRKMRMINESRAEIQKCETSIEQLTLWESLDIPMRERKTAKTTVFTGTFPGEHDEDGLASKISERAPDCAFDLTVLKAGAGQTAVCIIAYTGDAGTVYAAVRELGFTNPADPTKHPPSVRRDRLRGRIEELKASVDEAEKEIRELSSRREDISFLCDYLTAKRDEYDELEKAGFGNTVMVCEGFIPEERIPDAEKICSGYVATAEFSVPEKEDDVPVVLENNVFNEPMESVVEMYSMPGRRDVDPSAVMAFFYYVLFGLMLSDAGYGILMTIFSAVVLRRTTVEGSMAKMLKMFFWCGISTTFWGLMFGSIFGDIIPVIYTEFLGLPAPDLALWFTPIDDAIKLLVFSLGIGICHLLLGLITATVVRWREGHPLDAILDNVPIMLLLIGAAPLGGSIFIEVPSILTQIGAYVAIAGMIGIVLFSARSSKSLIGKIGGGLYALYNNASGYLSDVLSYSRLLALGLATGSIAEVINMMGTLPENKAVKGGLLIVVFIVGHALNMAINLLGAYVHTVRLQFVELFPKFYEGGGRAMKPFAMYTKYFKIRKDKSSEKKISV